MEDGQCAAKDGGDTAADAIEAEPDGPEELDVNPPPGGPKG